MLKYSKINYCCISLLATNYNYQLTKSNYADVNAMNSGETAHNIGIPLQELQEEILLPKAI